MAFFVHFLSSALEPFSVNVIKEWPLKLVFQLFLAKTLEVLSHVVRQLSGRKVIVE